MSLICVAICFNPVHSGLRRDEPLSVSHLDPNKSATKLVRAVLRAMLKLDSEEAHQEIQENNFELVKCHCNSTSRDIGLGTVLDMGMTLKELGIKDGDSVSVKKAQKHTKMDQIVESTSQSQTSPAANQEETYNGIEKRVSNRKRQSVDHYRPSISSSTSLKRPRPSLPNPSVSTTSSTSKTLPKSSSTIKKQVSTTSILKKNRSRNSSSFRIPEHQARIAADNFVMGCNCGWGSGVDEQVACDSCGLWYHKECIDSDPKEDEDWFCKFCWFNSKKHRKGSSKTKQPPPKRQFHQQQQLSIPKDQLRLGCGCLDPSGRSVSCDGCGEWFHYKCIGVTTVALLPEWHCIRCKSIDRSNVESGKASIRDHNESKQQMIGRTTSPSLSPLTSPETSFGELMPDDLAFASRSSTLSSEATSSSSNSLALDKLRSLRTDLQRRLLQSNISHEDRDGLLEQVKAIETILVEE